MVWVHHTLRNCVKRVAALGRVRGTVLERAAGHLGLKPLWNWLFLRTFLLHCPYLVRESPEGTCCGT